MGLSSQESLCGEGVNKMLSSWISSWLVDGMGERKGSSSDEKKSKSKPSFVLHMRSVSAARLRSSMSSSEEEEESRASWCFLNACTCALAWAAATMAVRAATTALDGRPLLLGSDGSRR